jgi:hypothetical protein
MLVFRCGFWRGGKIRIPMKLPDKKIRVESGVHIFDAFRLSVSWPLDMMLSESRGIREFLGVFAREFVIH